MKTEDTITEKGTEITGKGTEQMATELGISETGQRLGISEERLRLKSARRIDEIIVHCSATREGKDFTSADIRRWHLQRGFNDIGYHFVVRLDGTVEPGRDINRVGAHCLNHNSRSIGVCYIGGLDRAGRPTDTRTSAQRSSLVGLLHKLRNNHPRARIRGHRDFAAKACPCFDATAEYATL